MQQSTTHVLSCSVIYAFIREFWNTIICQDRLGTSRRKVDRDGDRFCFCAGYYKAWWRDLPKGPAHFGVSLSPGA